MFGRHVAIALISAAGTTYLVRELGPAAWGGFAISYLLLVSADTLLERNLLAGLARPAIPADRETLASAARFSLVAGGLLATGLAGLPWLLRHAYDPPDLELLFLASAGCMLLYGARALPLILLERAIRYREVAVVEVAEMVGFYAIAVAGVALGYGMEAVAAGTLMRGVTSLVLVRAWSPSPWVGARMRSAARVLLPFGVPLAAVTIVGVLDGLVPVLVIGGHPGDVGFLAIAASVLGYGLAALSVLQRVGLPAYASLSPVELRHAVKRSEIVGSFLTVAVMAPAGGLAAVWVVPVLGPAWSGGVAAMQLVALGLLAAGPIGVFTAALTGAGRSRRLLAIQGGVTAGYALAAVVLVAVLGPIGCAAGYAVSRWGWALVLAGVCRRDLGITPSWASVKLILTGLGVYLALVTTSASEPLAWIVAPVVGAMALWICREEARFAVRAVTARYGARPALP